MAANMHGITIIQLTLIVSNSVDSNFRLSQIFIEVPNFVEFGGVEISVVSNKSFGPEI